MQFKDGNEFLSNLVDIYCPSPPISSTIGLATYYRKCESLFLTAIDVVKHGNDADAYVELMRYANLVVALSAHNSYSSKHYEKDKNLNMQRVSNVIAKLEELKPKLVGAYNAEIEKERIRSLQNTNKTHSKSADATDNESLSMQRRKRRKMDKVRESNTSRITGNDSEDDDDDEPPDEFLCPISYELMKDPVIVKQSGWSYERNAITEWIAVNGNDPKTRDPCSVEDLIPNRTLKATIERWGKNK